MLIFRFSDILMMHSIDGWAVLPSTILRQNIYTDPRKPVAVEPGLKEFGTPDENAPFFDLSPEKISIFAPTAQRWIEPLSVCLKKAFS